MKIALDAMGGDHAPEEIVRGAVLCSRSGSVSAEDIFLCGDEEQIREILKREGAAESGFPISHAPEVIGMEESPIDALRKKPNASVLGGIRLVAEKKAEGLVTMGNTGAAVAGATLGLRLLQGVRRPGIAAVFPGAKGPVVVIDVGANIKCKPIHLFQYGLMASQYAEDVLGLKNPRVALLNIGEEDAKGNPLVKETREMLSRSDLNFVGNMEGQDIFWGAADVVVCEGFVGNVVLKVSEGLAGFLGETFFRCMKNAKVQDGHEELMQLKQKLDYAEHGGAILLGVDGIVVIGHGRSDAKAVANAILSAERFVSSQVNRHILAGLEKKQNPESQIT